MLKKYKKTLIVTTILLLLPMLVGLLLWNRLPEQVPMHWNFEGEVDDWGSRAMLVFFLPLFMIAIQWICILATAADPKNKQQADKPIRLVLWLVPVISLITHGATYAAALGLTVEIQQMMIPVLGIVFILIGNYLPKCRRNYTIGIKIPWTLNDDENWVKTHRLAGIIWSIGGALILLTVFLPTKLAFVVFMTIVMAMILAPIGYSYLHYRRHGAAGGSISAEEETAE